MSVIKPSIVVNYNESEFTNLNSSTPKVKALMDKTCKELIVNLQQVVIHKNTSIFPVIGAAKEWAEDEKNIFYPRKILIKNTFTSPIYIDFNLSHKALALGTPSIEINPNTTFVFTMETADLRGYVRIHKENKNDASNYVEISCLAYTPMETF